MLFEKSDFEYLIANLEEPAVAAEAEVRRIGIEGALKRNMAFLARSASFYASGALAPCTREGTEGYLHAIFDGRDYYVPWQLVKSLPPFPVLCKFLSRGLGISFAEAEAFCISGSFVISSSDIEIGDLDYSQYSPKSSNELVASLGSKTCVCQDTTLLKVAYGNKEKQRDEIPWGDIKGVYASMGAHQCIEQSERLMTDYLINIDSQTFPASNVVLPTSFDIKSSTAKDKSFSFQEVLTTMGEASDLLPWALADIAILIRYIQFLSADFESYRVKKPVKALKRAYCLCLILGLDDLADDAHGLLCKEEITAYVLEVRHREVVELIAMVEHCGTAHSHRPPACAPSVEPLNAEIFDKFFTAFTRDTSWLRACR